MRKRAARIKQRIQAHQRRRSVNKTAASEQPQDSNTRHDALMAQLRSIFRACHNGGYAGNTPESERA